MQDCRLFFRAPSRGKQTVLTSVMLILSGYTTLSAHPNVTNKQEHQLSQLFELGIISEAFQAFYSIDILKCPILYMGNVSIVMKDNTSFSKPCKVPQAQPTLRRHIRKKMGL